MYSVNFAASPYSYGETAKFTETSQTAETVNVETSLSSKPFEYKDPRGNKWKMSSLA